MKKFLVVVAITLFTTTALADQPREKFYDFGEMLIDGEIRKPTALYMDSKQIVPFVNYNYLQYGTKKLFQFKLN